MRDPAVAFAWTLSMPDVELHVERTETGGLSLTCVAASFRDHYLGTADVAVGLQMALELVRNRLQKITAYVDMAYREERWKVREVG
jgi:hypothetical protein